MRAVDHPEGVKLERRARKDVVVLVVVAGALEPEELRVVVVFKPTCRVRLVRSRWGGTPRSPLRRHGLRVPGRAGDRLPCRLLAPSLRSGRGRRR